MTRRLLIVDDEKIARDRILRFLKNYPASFEIYEAENGPQALKQITEKDPDVIFLDIQMPEMTGFDVLRQLPVRKAQIIFQTAYDEFAVQAFEVNACDYLLKPFAEEKLHLSLKKALLRHDQQTQLQKLEEHLKKSERYLKTLSIKQGGQTKILSLDEVIYFKSEDHYSFAVTDKSEVIVDVSLSKLQESLDPKSFIRIHRHSLVRLSSIDRIGNSDSSQVQLKNGMQLAVSRESKKKLLAHFKNSKSLVF